jgi:hypothetical protein
MLLHQYYAILVLPLLLLRFPLILLHLHLIKKNFVALAREKTIPAERPPLGCASVPSFAYRGCCVVSAMDPHGRILGFLDRGRYYVFHVAPQLSSRGWVNPGNAACSALACST